MSGVTARQILILPDTAEVADGQIVTPELEAQGQPLETFVALNAEDALAEALGLVLRTAVADGKITDEE